MAELLAEVPQRNLVAAPRDVTDEAGADAVLSAIGYVNALVNNLGIFGAEPALEITGARFAQAQWDAMTVASSGYRRAPGLRREQVAVLAGLSADYYTRSEQGRQRPPAPEQVLSVLARALDVDALAHLFRLAGRAVFVGYDHRDDTVSDDLTRLMSTWHATSAYVIDRAMDVLAQNDLARALHSGLTETDNLARSVFLDPAGRDFYVDWERAAHSATGHLRLAQGHDPRDPRLLELLEELTRRSAAFRELWSRHDVRGKTRLPQVFRLPDVGVVTLTYEALDVRSDPGLQLIIHHAPAGSPSAEVLALLDSLAAPLRQTAD